MSNWATGLQELIQAQQADGRSYSCVVRKDSERQIFYPVVKLLSHGVESETEYHHEFFGSSEYRSLRSLGEQLHGLFDEDGYVRRGEKQLETRLFSEAIDWLMKEAAKGYNIQRYKGLGEMNPDQLWDTTVNPETRRLMQVRIEDAVAADEIFTTLMGDQVEPRRDFIETNALTVENLDV